MKGVRRAFIVVLVVICLSMMINPVNAGTTSSSFIDWTQDYVEVESNLHDPSDKGTHSAFANMQSLDLTNDTLTEADQGGAGNNVEDFVDQISDLHLPDTDVGTHAGGGFAEMQDKDGTFDILTEENTGGAGGSEWLSVNANDTAMGEWNTPVGSAPYLDIQDEPTNYVYTKTDGDTMGYFMFADTGLSGSGISLNFSVYGMHDDGPTGEMTYLWWGHNGSYYTTGNLGFETTYGYKVYSITGETFTATEVNNMQFYLEYDKVAGADEAYVDFARMGTTQGGADNYDLDLEVGWITADYDETSGEELCIFGGTQGSEALRVDVWSGSWVNIITDLAAGWTNTSVSAHLTSQFFEIRFYDTTDDAVEADTWQVEGVLLHCWTDAVADYELDLEVGWTVDTDYDETVEELCIFAGPQNAEALKVDIWDGAWTNVIADLTANAWNNVSISSYLTSNAFEIRFIDADQASDASEGTWEIDAVLIKVYSYAYVREDYDAMDLSEVESTASGFARSYNEAFDLSEIESLAATFGSFLYDAIDLNETYSRALTMVRTFDEAIGISEVVIPAANFALMLLEALGIAAFLSTQKSIVKSLYEGMDISGTYGTVAVLARTYGEAFNLSDSIANAATLFRTYSETFDLSDAYATAATLVRGFGEAIGLTDKVSTEVFLSQFLYESITTAEDYGTAATLVRVYNESIGISDALTTAATLFRTYGEQFNISEFESAARVFERTYYETFGLSEVEVTVVEFSRILYDSITVAAAKALSADFVRNMAEAMTVVATIETIKSGGGVNYEKYLFDDFDLNDGVITAGGFIRNFFESITLAGFNENVRGFYKDLFESIVASADRGQVGVFVRRFEDVIGYNHSPFGEDAPVVSPGRPRTRNPDEGPTWAIPEAGFAVSVVGLGIFALYGAYSEYKKKRADRPTYATRRARRKKVSTTYQRPAKSEDGLLGWKKIGRVIGLISASSKVDVVAPIEKIRRSRIDERRKTADKAIEKRRKRFERRKATDKTAEGRRKRFEKEMQAREKRLKQRVKEAKRRMKDRMKRARRR